jgi:hypothetical protein
MRLRFDLLAISDEQLQLDMWDEYGGRSYAIYVVRHKILFVNHQLKQSDGIQILGYIRQIQRRQNLLLTDKFFEQIK